MKREEIFGSYEKCSLLQLNAIFGLDFFYIPKQIITMINNNVSNQVTSYFSACWDLLTRSFQSFGTRVDHILNGNFVKYIEHYLDGSFFYFIL